MSSRGSSKDNNVNFVVRWWTKSQRAYEVRTRAQAVRAIKQCCEVAGNAIPDDTKISVAQPEFVVVQKKMAAPAPVKAPSPSTAPKLSELHTGSSRSN